MHRQDGYQPLVLAARGGDKAAFSELVKRFGALAVAECRKQLSDPGLAEDAAQEAFLLAFLKLPSLNDANAFPAWFRKILRTCCNRIRKQDMSSWLCGDEPWLNMPDKQPDPLADMGDREVSRVFHRVLGTLDGLTREACIQRLLMERTYKEIAVMLNLPEGTVKRKVHLAKRKLVRALSEHQREAIRVGYLPISDHLLGMLAHFFQDPRQYRIHLQKFLSWSSLVSALKGNMLDAAFIMAPLAMELHNQGVPIEYVLDAHYEGSAITVHKNHELKGGGDWGRLGMPYPVSTHSLLFANMHGIGGGMPETDQKAKYQGPSYLINSLASRHIDAFFCAEPWNTQAVHMGTGRIYARSKDLLPGHMCCIMVVRKEFMAIHGEILRHYLRSLQSMNDYVFSHPNQSAAIQAKYTGVPVEVIKEILRKQEIIFGDMQPDRGRIESFMNMAVKTGILKQACSLDTFVRTDIL